LDDKNEVNIRIQSEVIPSHAGLLSRPVFLHVIWVLTQNHKVLQHALLDWNVLLGSQFCPLPIGDENRRGVSLETRDCLGFSGLPDHVDSLTNADIERHRFEFVIELNRNNSTTKRDLGYMARERKYMK
jgi:hypothetical protein